MNGLRWMGNILRKEETMEVRLGKKMYVVGNEWEKVNTTIHNIFIIYHITHLK